jgi:flagellar basal body-associated protein FliL
MAEKENKDDNKKSEKKFQFNLKKMVLIPFAGIISISTTIFLALFIAGRFVGVGPFAPTLSLEEQIAEAEALENLDIEEEAEEPEECEQLNRTKADMTPQTAQYLSARTKSIEDVTVNIKDTNGRRFIVASVAIQALNAETISQLDEIEHWIHEKIISDLRAKTLDDVLDMEFQNKQSKYFKEMIEDFMNLTVTDPEQPCLGIIDSVIFTKLMIQ